MGHAHWKDQKDSLKATLKMDISNLYQQQVALENRLRSEEPLLERRITLFSRIGWGLVAVGFYPLIHGVVAYLTGSLRGLAELGDFLGGTMASAWTLAGLCFVYVGFLGQKQQLLLQQLELSATRTELEGQKRQLENQFRLASYPYLVPEITAVDRPDKDWSFKLSISNVGNIPAFDLQFYAVGETEHSTEEGPETSYSPLILGNLPVVTHNKKYSIGLGSGTYHDGVYLLLQFRNLIGENHIELYHFYRSFTSGNFDMTSKEPKSVTPLPRLSISIWTQTSDNIIEITGKVKIENDAPSPQFIPQEVLEQVQKLTIFQVASDSEGEWSMLT